MRGAGQYFSESQLAVLRLSRLAVILWLVAQAAFAADQEFAFALPEQQGSISLGIFDAKGKLVRTLAAGATEKDFKAGLNGLIAKWDGLDDAQAALPAGKYHVEGFVGGERVKAEGVAYHFNDWYTDEVTTNIGGVQSIIPAEGEGFLVSGTAIPGREYAGQALWKFEDALSLRAEVHPLPGRLLGGEAGRVLAGPPGAVALMTPGPPPEIVTVEAGATGYERGVIWKERAYLERSGGRELDTFGLPKLSRGAPVTTPADFSMLDANDATMLVSDGTDIWQWRGQDFQKLLLAERPEKFSLSAGPGETLWLAGGAKPDFVARQHAFDGELLREMKLNEPGVEEVRIFADKKALRFFLVLSSGQGTTVRGYRPASGANGGEGVADWEVFLDRTMSACARFGVVDGKLTADAGEAAPVSEQKITLPPTTLNAKQETLAVKVIGGKDGVWLQTAQGLPLVRVSETPDFERVMLLQGETPGTMRVFAGNGSVVAEYLVSGLDQIAPIEAGGLEIGPAKSSP